MAQVVLDAGLVETSYSVMFFSCLYHTCTMWSAGQVDFDNVCAMGSVQYKVNSKRV